MRIKVAITDDHPLVINGLYNILNNSHIEVQAAYTSGAALLEGLKKMQPDVLLLDMKLPDTTGNDLARIVTKDYPDIRILVLTSIDTPFHMKDMIQSGCLGYILKNTEAQTLLTAIEQVYAGEQFIEPSLKEELLQDILANKPKTELPKLTRREKEVLQHIVAECTTQEIADKLSLSPRTIDTHRLNLLQKFGVKNTVGLIKSALQSGLIQIR